MTSAFPLNPRAHVSCLMRLYRGLRVYLVFGFYLAFSVASQSVCIAVAVLLYYLCTASFTWMLVEAIHLFLKAVTVFDIQLAKMRYYLALGWGE